jgi:hypothetical protein
MTDARISEGGAPLASYNPESLDVGQSDKRDALYKVYSLIILT